MIMSGAEAGSTSSATTTSLQPSHVIATTVEASDVRPAWKNAAPTVTGRPSESLLPKAVKKEREYNTNKLGLRLAADAAAAASAGALVAPLITMIDKSVL